MFDMTFKNWSKCFFFKIFYSKKSYKYIGYNNNNNNNYDYYYYYY